MEKEFIMLISIMLIIDLIIYIKTYQEKRNIRKLQQRIDKAIEYGEIVGDMGILHILQGDEEYEKKYII